MAEYKIGDRVQLNADAIDPPVMIVTGIRLEKAGSLTGPYLVKCFWFDFNENGCEVEFPDQLLKPSEFEFGVRSDDEDDEEITDI